MLCVFFTDQSAYLNFIALVHWNNSLRMDIGSLLELVLSLTYKLICWVFTISLYYKNKLVNCRYGENGTNREYLIFFQTIFTGNRKW